MTYTQVQTKLNQSLTTNASGDYALRTIIEGDQTVTNLTVTGTLTAAEIDGDVAPQASGSAGSVAVISDVQSSMLYNKLAGKIFDKNVLLRDGDEQTSSTIVNQGTGDMVSSTDVILSRTEVTAIDGGANFEPHATSSVCKFRSTVVLSAVGVNYSFPGFYAPGDGTILIRPKSNSGSTTWKQSIFNLTSLGTLTADHVTMMNAMATLNGWTITGTLSTSTRWDAIATWMSTTADRNEFFAIAIPSHVSSMEGAIVEEVVNYGGNLAYNDGNLLWRESMTDQTAKVAIGEGSLTINATDITQYQYIGYAVKVEPNTEYSMSWVDDMTTGGMAVIEQASNPSYSYPTTSLATHNYLGVSSATFTTDPLCRYIVICFWMTSAASVVGDKLTNIQLNAGSTASTYSEPLYSPFEMGQKSDQLLKDGAGEMGASRWTGAVLTGTDLIVSASATPAVTPFTARQSGIHTFAVKNTTADAATVTGDLNSITSSAVAGSATPPWSVSTVELVAGTTYDFTVTASVNTTKIQAMIIFGEYTQAQIESRGYEDYDGIDLLTCPNNAGTSTVSDTLEQDAQGRIMFTPYVQRNAGYLGVGSPEVDTTDTYASTGDFTGDFAPTKGAEANVTFDGETNAYRFTLDNTAGIHYSNNDAPVGTGITAGLKYRVTYSYHIPSGQSNVDGIRMQGITAVTIDREVLDAWTTVSQDVIAVGTNLYFTALDGGSNSFTDAGGDDVFYIKDVIVTPYNIQENLAPEPVDYTPYVIKGNLNQLAEVGQNHQVSSDGMLVYTTHYLGLGASLENIKSVISMKADKTELTPEYRVKVILPILASGGETVFLFTDFQAVDPDFPWFIQDAVIKSAVYGDTDLTAVAYNTALVVMASGDSADDIECTFIIGSAKQSVTVDKSA